MFHKNRVWVITEAESAKELAETLTQYVWCGCNGFRCGDYLFVNDSTSGDGAQEYAILRHEGDDWIQIESITFSWLSVGKKLTIINRILAGEFDAHSFGVVNSNQIQTPKQHDRCPLCA